MEHSFNYSDFDFPNQEMFDSALTCGPIIRAEIRKSAGDVRHAQVRLGNAELVHKTESEQAGEETSMTKFIALWVELHREKLDRCKAKLAFIRSLMADLY